MPIEDYIETLGPIGMGAAKIIGGKRDYKKNKELLDNLADPFYKIQDEYFQNRDIAANEAGYGLDQASQDYYTSESQRGLGTSLNAATMGSGSPNYISDILDTYNRGIRATATQGSQLRTQKMQEFFNRNDKVAGQKTIQWHLNEYQPNQNKRALYSGNMVAAKQNQTQGINDILGLVSTAANAFAPGAGTAINSVASSFSPMNNATAPIGNPVNTQYSPPPQLPSNAQGLQVNQYLTNPPVGIYPQQPQPYTPPNWGYIQP